MNMHLVAIAPDEHRSQLNDLVEALGWGPDSFSVPLSSDGYGPASHWGLATPVSDTFIVSMGEFEDELSSAVIDTAVAASITPRLHFDSVLERQGLQVILGA